MYNNDLGYYNNYKMAATVKKNFDLITTAVETCSYV